MPIRLYFTSQPPVGPFEDDLGLLVARASGRSPRIPEFLSRRCGRCTTTAESCISAARLTTSGSKRLSVRLMGSMTYSPTRVTVSTLASTRSSGMRSRRVIPISDDDVNTENPRPEGHYPGFRDNEWHYIPDEQTIREVVKRCKRKLICSTVWRYYIRCISSS